MSFMCQKEHRMPYLSLHLIPENAQGIDVCKDLRIHVEDKTPCYKPEH